MTCNRYAAVLGGVFVLPMTSCGRDQVPAVIFNQFDNLTNLHRRLLRLSILCHREIVAYELQRIEQSLERTDSIANLPADAVVPAATGAYRVRPDGGFRALVSSVT